MREAAQCPDEDQGAFQDITRYQYFNTNNLWFHLPSLQQMMEAQEQQLGLPIIRNRKTVDPRDPNSTAVYQLETAMGSAIAVFAGAQAIRVGRERFAPVKTTNELLAVRSDAYELTEDFRVIPGSGRRMRRFVVQLDPTYYKFISDLEDRFPHGAPSLKQCARFEVKGDVCFGKDVICQGQVVIENRLGHQVMIPEGTILEGRQIFS